MARQKSTSGIIIIILIEKGLTCISQEKKIIYRSFALSLFHHVALFYPVIQQSKNVRWTRSNNITVSAAAKAKPPLLPPSPPLPIPPVDSSLTNQLTLPHTSNSIHTTMTRSDWWWIKSNMDVMHKQFTFLSDIMWMWITSHVTSQTLYQKGEVFDTMTLCSKNLSTESL